MKTYIDCIPCVLKQVLKTSRLITDDEKVQKKVIDEVMVFLTGLDCRHTPPDVARRVYAIISEVTHCDNPYREVKSRDNRMVLGMYPRLNGMVQAAPDSLATAIRLAVAGNIIDYGAEVKYHSLDEIIRETLEKPFAVYDYKKLKDRLGKSKILLYLGDNAGEIVFDKLLIEELLREYKLKIYFAVRGSPIINDVTVEDAEETGMNDIVEVIDNGQGAPGTILDLCSEAFLKVYSDADIIISKGQGNYETLDEEKGKDIYFLLKVKCPLIAGHLKMKEGDIILKKA